MTNAAGASVWSAVWLPWGGAHAIPGAEINDARFPGQWFQLEAGLRCNWHRNYDSSLGRFTQPDPLGFVDGPSVYGYSRGSPHRYVDKDGRYAQSLGLCATPAGAVVCGGVLITAGIIYMCTANDNDHANDNDRPAPPPTIEEKSRCENIRQSEQDACDAEVKATGDWGEYKDCSKQAWANYYNCMGQSPPPTHFPPKG